MTSTSRIIGGNQPPVGIDDAQDYNWFKTTGYDIIEQLLL